jgi:hypothetical protein
VRNAVKKTIGDHAIRLAIAVLLAGPAAAHAQRTTTEGFRFALPEVATTYDIERAKIANSSCDCFWLQGGSSEVAVPFYRTWSLVGTLGGSHASNIQPGVDLSRLTWLAGPRFSYDSSRFTGRHGSILFGQYLAGGTHGFDSVFPASGGVTSSANSYAFEAGGGLEIGLAGGLGLRAFEINYVRTALPNSATNTQNDLRLAFGVAYSFRKSKSNVDPTALRLSTSKLY